MPPPTAHSASTDLMPGKDKTRMGAKAAVTPEYVIYNVNRATTAKRGADWFRYGTMRDKTDALQLALELYRSEEFARVEVHETITDAATGNRKTRILKVHAVHGWMYKPVTVLLVACAILAACAASFTFLP